MVFKYRNIAATSEDIKFIQQLIGKNPGCSRRSLSVKLCEAWNLIQPNGKYRDMVVRSFMLELDRAGHITLPPKKCFPNNPLANRVKPSVVKIEQISLTGKLSEIQPINILQVRRTQKEKLFNSLIDQFHYLGYTQPVGEHLKYIAYVENRPIACFAFCSAPRHIGCRDRFIGWTQADRKKRLHLIAYNTRFLILPWVRIKCLASHLLGRIVKQISDDWQKLYQHPIYFCETFVDKEKFKGTCYRAGNWIYLGDTKGLGKDNRTGKINRSIKAVYGYPLSKDFRKRLWQSEKK